MKNINFYRTISGNCPVEDHLASLTDAQVTKIAWVLKLIREIDHVPANYSKELLNTDDIWEVRIDVAKSAFRLLGFFYGNDLIILTNSFQKKRQKTPKREIELPEKRKKEYLNRR